MIVLTMRLPTTKRLLTAAGLTQDQGWQILAHLTMALLSVKDTVKPVQQPVPLLMPSDATALWA
jgi:hypothetical protein